jgi:hypothetical protein
MNKKGQRLFRHRFRGCEGWIKEEIWFKNMFLRMLTQNNFLPIGVNPMNLWRKSVALFFDFAFKG